MGKIISESILPRENHHDFMKNTDKQYSDIRSYSDSVNRCLAYLQLIQPTSIQSDCLKCLEQDLKVETQNVSDFTENEQKLCKNASCFYRRHPLKFEASV